MNKFLFLFILFFSPLIANAQTREAIQGYCERGGEVVVTDSRSSTTKVQRTFASCTVTVYVAGTTTPANLATDTSGTPKSNPFTADTDGYWKFYVPAGRYDVRMSGSGITTPFTRSGYWVSLGGASPVANCEAGKMLYYATGGASPSCLTVGTNLSISSGTLNATGGTSTGGSGTVQEGNRGAFAYYPASGTTVTAHPSFSSTILGGVTNFSMTGSLTNTQTFNGSSSSTFFALNPTLNLSNPVQSFNSSVASVQPTLNVTAGNFNFDTSGVSSSVNVFTGSTTANLNGFYSKLVGNGGSGSAWSGFRSAYTHNSTTVPASLQGFYAEPPTIMSGTIPSYTAFFAPTPASLSPFTTYQAFYSTGGSSRFIRNFSSDAIELVNGMPLRLFAPNSSAYAAWAYSPSTTPVGSYTYLFPNSAPTNNQLLAIDTVDSGNVQLKWLTSAASGSVSSVGLAAPVDVFTVSNSPVVTSGALTLGLTSQSANRVWASPNGATGTPTFRALVAADIPNLASVYQPYSANLNQLSGLSGVEGSLIQYNTGAWTIRSVQDLKTSMNLANVENQALSTWTGSNTIATLGTISTGSWNASVIPATKGGAGTVAGILKANGSGVVSAASAGTDFESPLIAGTGLSRTINTFSVNTSQNISTLSNLTSNGLIKTSGGTGALSIATPSVDFAPPTTGSQILYGNNSGGFSNVTIGSGLQFVSGQLYSTSAGGSVTNVAVANANGFTASVANPTGSAAITLYTTVNGMVKANGLALSAASNVTDYVAPGPITTSPLTVPTANRLLGRTSTGTGAVEEIQISSGLNLTGSVLTASTTQTISTLSNLAGLGTGYVTVSNTGAVSHSTPAQVTAALSQFSTSTQGVVPSSGGGTTNFLRADGTWAAPPSGGGGGSFNTITTRVPYYNGTSWGNSSIAIPNANNSLINIISGTATDAITSFATITKNSSANSGTSQVLTLNAITDSSALTTFGGSISLGTKVGASANPIQIAEMDWGNLNTSSSTPAGYIEFKVSDSTGNPPVKALQIFPTNIRVGGEAGSGRLDLVNSSDIATFPTNQAASVSVIGGTSSTINTSHPGGAFGVLLPHEFNPGTLGSSWTTSPGIWWTPDKTGSLGLGKTAGFWFEQVYTDGFNFQGSSYGSNLTIRTAGGSAIGNPVFQFAPGVTGSESVFNLSYNGSYTTSIRFNDQNGSKYAGLAAPQTLNNSVTYLLPTSKPTGASGDAYDVLSASTEGGMVWSTVTGTGNVVRSANATITRPRISTETHGTITAIASPANGTLIYCTDCTNAPVCAVGGNGALAVYSSFYGNWRCQ